MCSCIDEVETKLVEAFDKNYKGKEITKITLNKVMPFNFKTGQIKENKVAIIYEIERVGTSRAAKEKIIATYCPFCGKEYDK